ncbi:MAG: SwmB domain-containing protein [bacterium]|nr:SwmB domain-containing protein [bacterium]
MRPPAQTRPALSLRRPAALLLVPLAVLVVSWFAGSPAGPQDDYEPDQQLVADIRSYAREMHEGHAHVLRWMRVLKTFGVLEDVTAVEAQGYADRGWERWIPVAEDLGKLESAPGDYQPDQQLVADVRSYAREMHEGHAHVLRWMRVLKTFGVLEDVTAVEAQGYADRGWERWVPVAAELAEMEASAKVDPTPEPGELQVSVTATPANPQVNETVTLRAAITDPPSGESPSYNWEIDLGGEWTSWRVDSTLSFLAGKPESWTFRVTVSYDSGPSATSAPLTVTWLPPNRAPVVDTQAANYASFVGTLNAPRGFLVSKSFDGIFSDPDGDQMTYAVSVPADRGELLEMVFVPTEEQIAQSGRPIEAMRLVGFQADAEGDWKAVSPALPDPFVTTVTLTATDPDGLSASVTGDFRTDWESHPALLGARSGGDDIELTFDQAVQPAPVPAPGQFAVNVVNTDGSSGTVAVSSVAVSGAVITLELDSTLESAQTVTLDYSHADDAPLKRAADGGDHAPGFTGQAVELIELPGPPANFEVSAEPGELGLSATWDAAEGATSYNNACRRPAAAYRRTATPP